MSVLFPRRSWSDRLSIRMFILPAIAAMALSACATVPNGQAPDAMPQALVFADRAATSQALQAVFAENDYRVSQITDTTMVLERGPVEPPAPTKTALSTGAVQRITFTFASSNPTNIAWKVFRVTEAGTPEEKATALEHGARIDDIWDLITRAKVLSEHD